MGFKANQAAKLDGKKVTVVEVKGGKAEVILDDDTTRWSVPVEKLK